MECVGGVCGWSVCVGRVCQLVEMCVVGVLVSVCVGGMCVGL